MPTYDYQCKECGHAFELFQSITAPVRRKCPSCGKLRLARLIGPGSGLIFRGSGFYCTDYRSSEKGRQPPPKADGATDKEPKDGQTKDSGSSPSQSQS